MEDRLKAPGTGPRVKVECDRVASVIGGSRDRMKIAAARHLFPDLLAEVCARPCGDFEALIVAAKRLLRSFAADERRGRIRQEVLARSETRRAASPGSRSGWRSTSKVGRRGRLKACKLNKGYRNQESTSRRSYYRPGCRCWATSPWRRRQRRQTQRNASSPHAVRPSAGRQQQRLARQRSEPTARTTTLGSAAWTTTSRSQPKTSCGSQNKPEPQQGLSGTHSHRAHQRHGLPLFARSAGPSRVHENRGERGDGSAVNAAARTCCARGSF